MFTRNMLSRSGQHLKESIYQWTKAAKSAKKQKSVDKYPPFVANPFNLIKHKGLIGVAAAKTDQYPSTLSPADAKTKRAAQQV
ncbi:hypothetical protein [Pseudomonas putida]|uniref:hypothetical protein n=1 Tax=Pseudomonas putida TaxID=303 RepID=UPI003D9783C1